MKRCKNCYYRRELFGFPDFPACHFAIEEGQLRNCEPECCTHFRPKRRKGPKSVAERAAEEMLRQEGDMSFGFLKNSRKSLQKVKSGRSSTIKAEKSLPV